MGAAVQLLEGALKSAGLLPPRLMAEIGRGAFPELVRVTLRGAKKPPYEQFVVPSMIYYYIVQINEDDCRSRVPWAI